MKTIVTFIAVRPLQIYYIPNVGVTYKFIRCFAVPRVESSINLRANSFGASYEMELVQDNRLKTYHTIGVLLPT